MSVARHTSYNIAGAVIPVLVSFVSVPLLLSLIGLERYGVLAICLLLLGYFNLFDFGLGRATAQKIASMADAEPAERSRVLWTSLMISAGFAVAAALLILPVGYSLVGLLKISDPAIKAETMRALPLLACALPLGIANSVLTGALQGRHAFLPLNLITAASNAGVAALPVLAAAVFGPHLVFVLAASTLARLAGVIAMSVVAARSTPLLGFVRPDRAEAGRMLRFGGWTTVSGVIAPLLSLWDRFAIGSLIGSAAVALYTVPFSLVAQIIVLPSSLASALFPKMAGATPEQARELSAEGIRTLSFLLTPATLIAIIGIGPFLRLWLGAEVGAASTGAAIILLVGFWANSFAWVAVAHLQAIGRPHVIGTLHLIEIVPYGVALFVLLKFWGIEGAALAWSLRTLADTTMLFVYSRMPGQWMARLAGDALLLIAAALAALFLPLADPWRWAVVLTALAITASVQWTRRPEAVMRIVAQMTARLRPPPALP